MVRNQSYEELCDAQKNPYQQWLKKQEPVHMDIQGKRPKLLPFLSCEESLIQCLDRAGESMSRQDEEEEDVLWLFYGENGQLCRDAQTIFAASGEADILYADEDYLDGREEPERCEPWFKPDYSPDTLKSFFYYGNVFALRAKWARTVWKHLIWETGSSNDTDVSIYEFVLYASGQTKKICHIPKVLYTNHSLKAAEELPGKDMKMKLIRNTNWWRQYHGKEIREKTGNMTKVSVIIPSKNHAGMLLRCLDTLTAKTQYPCYELIIVDNGSDRENRQRIISHIDHLEQETGRRIRYLYQPQSFNFSVMCNQGAAAAKGKYLLFLNDDIEITDGMWMTHMLSLAIQFHVGAVGAKLLYPKAEGQEEKPYRIQHVGITNMGIGPAHKLGGFEDVGSLYHGHNLVTYNMIAVTAACLMVDREKFRQVKGFDAQLAVAYNDVDFCFKLHEAGYLNAVCNEAVLIHHESMSRGQDDTPERKERLAGELALLYSRHPELKGNDPFYSRNLVMWKKDAAYSCNYLYPCDKKVVPVRCSKRGLPHTHENRFVRKLTGENLSMLQIDHIETEQDTVTVDGWYVLREHDNGELTRSLLLKNEDNGKIYQVPLYPKLREDVEALFASDDTTTRTALAGIHAVIDRKELPGGHYTIGILADTGEAGGLGKHGERIQYAARGGCIL